MAGRPERRRHHHHHQQKQPQQPTSSSTQFQVLADRFTRLEQSQAELTEQFTELLEEKVEREDSGEVWLGRFFPGGIPYRRILESVGHAVHVRRASSGEIIYWNPAAESLYGWKDYEVIGYRTDEILIPEEHWMSYLNIMERLSSGQSWSGLFPFKKKSGERFMAMVTKTPLYEAGKLTGVISVSSDASLVHDLNWENVNPLSQHASGLPRPQGFNFKRISWNAQPSIPPVPQLASSVSRLASKVLSWKSGETTQCSPLDGHNDASEANNDMLEKPGKLAAKFLEKLHIGGTRSNAKEQEVSNQYNICNNSRSTNITFQPNNFMAWNASSSSNGNIYPRENEKTSGRSNGVVSSEGKYPHIRTNEIPAAVETSTAESPPYGGGCNQQCEFAREAEGLIISTSEINDEVQDIRNVVSSGGDSMGSHGSSSSKGDNELSAVSDCEIHWEELQLGEEIGQGSYAVVYHGIWKGSDVAVKVFFGNEYSESILQDYKKEIDIMKRLRHPNVLLFMGAIYSPERLGIVTEFMPRGSLFKTLHRNSQALDLRRRLRMALDVARGMNYLHHRNPPIVHRDLKSSNLLVDRNWTVKVADFGLSRFKDSTLLTTKSGRGTPQWMAPEVLRNEPSNEKSDVFSYGVILWELVTQSIPWNNLNSLQVVGIVGFMDRRLDLPEGIDPPMASLISDCWKSDPNQRPSFEEILKRMTCLVRRAAATLGRRNSDS